MRGINNMKLHNMTDLSLISSHNEFKPMTKKYSPQNEEERLAMAQLERLNLLGDARA